jgi:hypothetical protein
MPKAFNMTMDAPLIQFDERRYYRDLHAGAMALLRGMARAFLEEASMNVSVDTGMAYGTMAPIARVLNLAFPIRRGPNRRARGARSDTNYDKSFEGGQARGRANVKMGPRIYSMAWSANLFHFMINELYRMPGNYQVPTPWHATEKGNEAAIRFLQDNWDRYLPFSRIPRYFVFNTRVRRK